MRTILPTLPKHLTSQHRNIIRPRLAPAEYLNMIEQFGVEVFGAFGGMVAQKIQQLFFSKFFSGRVAHLGETVGIGENYGFVGEAEAANFQERQFGQPAQ